jgi:DNA-binding GntR family transcriptional regulator
MADASRKLAPPVLGPVSRRTISREVADAMRAAIITGSFAAGDHLAEVALAEQFKVSRAPIREAMLELAGEGLLVFDRRGAARVPDFSGTDLEEIGSLRLTLESMAARLACRNFNGEFQASFEANIEQTRRATRLLDLSMLDVEFHDHIVKCARHSRLYGAWANLRHQIELWLGRMYARLDMPTDKAHGLMVRHHQKILDVLRSGDEDRAEKLVREHIERWHRRHLRPEGVEEMGAAESIREAPAQVVYVD